MWIKNIKIKNFRNYEEEKINLEKNINIFYGENAQGKTNIIEAIFLCSLGKSFRAKKDIEMIKLNEENAIVEIEYEKSDREGKIKIELGNKKNIYLNGIKIKKLSELLGNLNIVIFTPDDINILKGGPQNRRRFLDVMISQLRPNYMHILNLYLKTIEQRNKYLRQIKEEQKQEKLLEIWDEKLAEYAEIIFHYRQEYIQKIKEKIQKIHQNITEGKEEINLFYRSDFENKEQFQKILKNHRKIDFMKGYTSKGIHHDDFEVFLNDKMVNVYGSQGQHRTAMLSLKMAELEVIEEEIGEAPILLLDDFMSELDQTRRKNFLQYIQNAQVIITGTEKMEFENLDYSIFHVQKGEIN